jgi:heme/copper-type cytochrome/quinol oxidase subunit 1
MMWLGYSGMPRRVLDYPSAMGGWHSIISSAHIITVSGVLTFVIMLFDSLRRQRSYTIKTFGVGRYNTRLNFYLYQIARNRYWVSKHLTLLPVRATWHVKSVSNNEVMNLEYMETTLFYFSFSKRPVTSTWLY